MEDAIVYSVRYRRKMALFVFLFIVSLLLFGAVKVTAGLSERKISRTAEKEIWTETVMRLVAEVPAENGAEWRELALRDPQLLLMANTSSFCFNDSSN